MTSRFCGDCTKCCEGWLAGEALGHRFYKGKPCHFIATGKGCSIYAKRPKEPCQTFKCAWLSTTDIPEWMKPSEINTILVFKEVNNIPYMSVIEAGENLDSKVLTWCIIFALQKNMNLYWEVNGGGNWIGSKEFIEEMNKNNVS